MSVQPIGPVPDSSRPALRNRARLLIIVPALTLAAVGAFIAWGPIGVGPGPIGDAVMAVSTTSRQQNCGGAWPLKGKQNFYRVCAAGGLVPLFGRPVPIRSRVNVRGLSHVTYAGIGAAIKAAPPGHAGCWMVTSVVIHYHLGIRHYTATHTMSLTACSSKAGTE